MWKSLFFLVFLVSLVFLFFLVSLVFLFFLVSLVFLVFLVPVLCSSVPFQPSPNKRAQAPVDSIEFPMGSKETLARNWSFHFSQVNYISLFIFVVDKDLSKNSCLTYVTTVLSERKTTSRIFIADETHLNKSKPSILAKYGRPQRDHIWLRGAVLQGHMKTHFIFHILEHPDDAYDGKPREPKEMIKNLNMLNLQKNDIFVSDKWLATFSAVKSIRRERHFSASDLNHEVVNHSKRRN